MFLPWNFRSFGALSLIPPLTLPFPLIIQAKHRQRLLKLHIQIVLVLGLFCVAFLLIWRTRGNAWPGLFKVTEGHDVSMPQNRIYFVVEWRGFPVYSCLVTIMILCHFIPILEILHLLLALGICHVLNFRYLFSYFFPHLPGMPHL